MGHVGGGLLVVGARGLIQSLFRLGPFCAGTLGGVQLLNPPPAYLMRAINIFSLLLEVIGVLVIIGLLLMRSWEYWGTLGISATTIAFDTWALITVAPTAAMGIVVPFILLIYLLPRHSKFAPKVSRT